MCILLGTFNHHSILWKENVFILLPQAYIKRKVCNPLGIKLIAPVSINNAMFYRCLRKMCSFSCPKLILRGKCAILRAPYWYVTIFQVSLIWFHYLTSFTHLLIKPIFKRKVCNPQSTTLIFRHFASCTDLLIRKPKI